MSGGTYSVQAGTVYNAGSGFMNLTCPLVKDGSSIASATAKVFDRNTGKTFSCTLNAESASGDFFTGTSETKTTPAGWGGSEVKSLSFGAQAAQDYYYMTCKVPQVTSGLFSHMGSIEIKEN